VEDSLRGRRWWWGAEPLDGGFGGRLGDGEEPANARGAGALVAEDGATDLAAVQRDVEPHLTVDRNLLILGENLINENQFIVISNFVMTPCGRPFLARPMGHTTGWLSKGPRKRVGLARP
jgi:hypothetical protein